MKPTLEDIKEIWAKIGRDAKELQVGKLSIISPLHGGEIAHLATHSPTQVQAKIEEAALGQPRWATETQRELFLRFLADALKANTESLGLLITYEAGKTRAEGKGEVANSIATLTNTIAHNTRMMEHEAVRERTPLGVVGLITSFNFPLAVANWTIAPALLAGNSVVWKPSEKTPLTALAYETIFKNAVRDFNAQHSTQIPENLVQVILGERDVGHVLVEHPHVAIVSATGSVAMGKSIKATLAKRGCKNQPILELGGNNAVIISDKNDDAHLARAATSLMESLLGTCGQRCTDTRRLIVHDRVMARFLELLKERYQNFIAEGHIKNPLEGGDNKYGFGPLIHAGAYQQFEHAKHAVTQAGGQIHFGARRLADTHPKAYYVEPAIAVLDTQTSIMHEETFAPLVYLVPYKGDVKNGLRIANAPENAGLVNGIYTQDTEEAEIFARLNEAGHGVINSNKGTGTPAYGMGFHGNKASGEGTILSPDPLRPFTHGKEVPMPLTSFSPEECKPYELRKVATPKGETFIVRHVEVPLQAPRKSIN